jgi:O-antigen/teichoic acid export membrane protein
MTDTNLMAGDVGGRPSDGRTRNFAWGLVSQIASSATNFGLSLLAGRTLGPKGLGAVFIGFSYYLLAWAFQRALVTDPLVASSSTLDDVGRERATRAALTASISWSLIAVSLGSIGAIVAPGGVGRGLLPFIPWLGPALVQDVWRVVLFRDGRGRAAAINDMIWLGVMIFSVPLAVAIGGRWAIVGCWGLGALAGMLVGFIQTESRPLALEQALRWWRLKAWPLGRWLSFESVVYALGYQGLIFVLALVLDAASLGGLRAVTTVFAPLTVLGPALALAGLPELSRSIAISSHHARTLAAKMGAVVTVLASGYFALTLLGGGRVLILIFGSSFLSFRKLVWPVGLGQLVVAPTLGYALLLKAGAKGKALLTGRIVGAVANFGLGLGLAIAFGVTGAAWGIALGSAVAGLALVTLAIRPSLLDASS